MFNLLISGSRDGWETDQLMRIQAARFKEFSPGREAAEIDLNNPASLVVLETVPSLLGYEENSQAATDEIRYGNLSGIHRSGIDIVFRFTEQGRFTRQVFREYSRRLGIEDSIELHRNHWAVKDGGIPAGMLFQLKKTYDLVFSFAGEDRTYVEAVAAILRDQGVRLFYDEYEATNLWGQNLAEYLPDIYARRGQYCVMFISQYYADKMWTRRERQAALDRALSERGPYILPCRFDNTKLEGLSDSVSYIQLTHIPPAALASKILQKLGRV